MGAYAADWSELTVRTWLEARRQPGRQRSYDVDVDAPMIALARRAVTVGWPLELAAWFVPKLMSYWPEVRAGDENHPDHLQRLSNHAENDFGYFYGG